MIIATGEQEKYLTELANGTAVNFADVSAEKGGKGHQFRPHDYLEAGYAACLNITTRMVLDKLGLAYEKVLVNVSLDRENPEETIFDYHIDIIGNLDEATKRKVIKLVGDCPVKKTLSKRLMFRCQE